MNADRVWNHFESALFAIGKDASCLREQVGAWVAEAFQALSAHTELPLPEYIVQQSMYSVINAICEVSSSDVHPSVRANQGQTIRFTIYLPEQESTRSHPGAPSTAQWGFFLVQRRSGEVDPHQLLLNLYIYKE